MPHIGTSEPKRALIFRLPGDESAANALSLGRCADGAGIDVTMVPYWPDDQPSWADERFLLDKDIGSAPRLSAFALQQRYGLSLDLLDLQAHSFATELAQPDLLLPESIWQQRLRGVAARLCDLFEREQPDLIFVAHGAEIISRLVTEVAAFKNIKAMFWESGFFPGHLYLDPLAPHFFRGLSSLEAQPALTPATPKTIEFIQRWKRDRQSKYVQNTNALARFETWKAGDTRPILFVAGQVPTDANAVVGLGAYANLQELYSALLKLPDAWRMVFKPHPKAPTGYDYGLPADVENIFCDDVPVIEAIESSSAVLVHSSNVGLEALLLGKPTLVTGQPIYLASGQTLPVTSLDQLRSLISRPLPAPQSGMVEKIVQSLLDTCLLDVSDTLALRQRAEKAQVPQKQRRLMDYYSDLVQRLVNANRGLHDALKSHTLLIDALEKIEPGDREILASACDLDLLQSHIYGGPRLPFSVYAPHPVRRTHKGAHITLPARLEECPFPEAYLHSQMADDKSTYSIGCVICDDAEKAGAQAFSEDDLKAMASRLGRKLEIDRHNLGQNTTATLFLSPSCQKDGLYAAEGFEDWLIPLEAFSKPENSVTDHAGRVILFGDHVHAVYGPYIRIPEGVWTVSWMSRTTPWLEWLKSRLFKSRWKKLSFEIIEKIDGVERVIQTKPYAQFKMKFLARKNATYELRPHWRGKAVTPSCKQARFDGLRLRWIGPIA